MKRVLALCLAMCMILCLSATAASVEFTDRGDIFNSEEASMLTSLGIIQGFPDGKFRPNDWVTRAQLAKMIYYMQNGVMDKSEDLSASYTGSDFSDVQGHWASGYIYYCARKGIISGYTDGTFKPDKNVSATEAAKMLLVSIGYDEDRYIGSQWLANTHFDAAVAGITNSYNDHMTATLNRDNAALFIYNTLFSAIISGENSGKTLIQTGYGAKRYTAVVIANEVAALEGAICGKGLTRVRTIGSDANVFMLNESSSAAELGHTYAVYVTANTDENGNHDLYGGFFTTPDDLTVIDTSRSVGFSDVVGYGKTFTARRKTKLAVLPVGYADGLLRCLSGKIDFTIGGLRAPQVGRICMDLCMAAIEEDSNVQVGDEVILYGEEPVSVENAAVLAGTISYELLASVTRRVPRIYHEGETGHILS